MSELKKSISVGLGVFSSRDLKKASIALLNTLGYRSQKTLDLDNAPEAFLEQFDRRDRPLRRDKALFERWKTIDFLFQVTDEEVQNAGVGTGSLFDSSYEPKNPQSYLFLALDLDKGHVTRTQLATIVREINRLFAMPALMLIRQGGALTFAVIDRRLHKRDESRDVLEKVKLIKDIRCENPHRAHVEILFDLALPVLMERFSCRDFKGLHEAWRQVLDIDALNDRFYRRIRDWFFLAAQKVKFPHGGIDDPDVRNRTALIRLLTRVMFCWFAREKGLIPGHLFEEATASRVLKKFKPDDFSDGGYYKAILQNLFFPTLSVPLDEREFRDGRRYKGKNDHYMDHSRFRHEDLFQSTDELPGLFEDIPFLNGGLFECLDYRNESLESKECRVDGFSDVKTKQPTVPNALFFGRGVRADLSDAYGSHKKNDVAVDGLFHILNAYKFTVAENTPVEQEIALDPELLGRIFEELLAEYNVETEAAARKATGSFYTPRIVVNYMVDQSLAAHLAPRLAQAHPSYTVEKARKQIAALLEWNDAETGFAPEERQTLADAIYDLTVIDPACGSGAFPMGMLQKLIFVLGKLDADHRRWIERTLADTPAALRDQMREQLRRSNVEYVWKLALIQRAIYGIDIQPIAAQIAKLRCFISLLVDFKLDDKKPNKGVPPLPNLDFKFVTANSLIRPPSDILPGGLGLEDAFFAEFAKAAEGYFFVREPTEKMRLRRQIESLIERKIDDKEQEIQGHSGAGVRNAKVRAAMAAGNAAKIERAKREIVFWESYRNIFAYRNKPVLFFDVPYFFPELKNGFDIVIGNPPFVRQEQIKPLKPLLQEQGYECYNGVADLFVYFFERGIQLLKPGGMLCYICSNKYFRSGYGEKLREHLTKETQIDQLIDFGDADIFTSIAYPSILLARKLGQKEALNPDQPVRALTWMPGPPLDDFPDVFAAKSFTLPQRELKKDGWRLEGTTVRDLLAKLRKAGKPLGEYVNGRFYRGILTGLNEAFVVDRETRDRLIVEHPSSKAVLKPFLRGRDVKRWCAQPQDLWLIFTRRGIDIRKYPAIHDYLKPFKKRLMPGGPGGRKPGSYEWHEIQDNIAYWQEFEKKKIIVPAIAETMQCTYDTSGFYVNNKASIFVPDNPKYVATILNSEVARWVTTQLCASKQGGFWDFEPRYSTQFPIPRASAAQQKALEKLVDQILAAKKKDAAADVSRWEREIDRQVYELYGLTEDEIKIVEGA